MQRPCQLIATLAASASIAAAQDWIQQSPYPTAEHLNTLHFLDADSGFITGDDGVFMVTSDGGATWTQHPDFPRDPHLSDDFDTPTWDISFVDGGQTGWAVGNGVWRTDDGGVTWDFEYQDGTIYGYHAASEQVIYRRGGGEGGLFRSDDGGESFETIWDGSVTMATFHGESLGLISVNDSVRLTTDGGQTWQSVYPQTFHSACFLDEQVVIGARQGRIYRSADGGHTWSLVHEDVDPILGNYMSDACAIDHDSVAVIDGAVRIWISNDAGLTWTRTQDAYGNWGSRWELDFPTPTVGYAIGRLGLIFKTTDGGQTWDQISNGAGAALRDIAMQPNGAGVAVGDTVVLRTDDFGCNWHVVPRSACEFTEPLEDGVFYAVEAITDDVFVIGGKGDFAPAPFFRSEDGGATWSQHGQAFFNLHSEIYDLEFLDESNGWLFGFEYTVGKDGLLMHTTDGGVTWEFVFEPFTTDRIPDGEVHSSGAAWAVHRGPDRLRRSDDFFATSETIDMPGPVSFWEDIAFDTDEWGWVGSVFGELMRTLDAGASLTSVILPGFIYDGDSLLMEIAAPNPNEAYIATHRWISISFGTVYHTTDGGQTWSLSDPIVDPTHVHGGRLTAMDVLPGGEIWTAGLYGYIYASDPCAAPTCKADCDGSQSLDVLDFVCFQSLWQEQQPEGDCDGNGDFDILDFVCFQAAFVAGCP